MSDATGRVLDWAPRILCIAFAAFISIFAMDVFSLRVDVAHKALALLMHLIPTALILVVLVVAWNRQWLGAVIFPLLAAYHAVTMWGRLDWSGYAVIDGPLVLLGILFLMSWLQHTSRPGSARA
jgi:hypothetical protein